MKTGKLYLVFLLSFCFMFIYGQEQKSYTSVMPDPPNQKTYIELEYNFYNAKNDYVKAEKYAKVYLRKSIDNKNIRRQLDAYYLLASISSPWSLSYAENIISITQNNYKENKKRYVDSALNKLVDGYILYESHVDTLLRQFPRTDKDPGLDKYYSYLLYQ